MPTASAEPESPLRRERLRLGISQVLLAARANCSLSTVSLAERGGFLSAAMAIKFAVVLGCELHLLRPTETVRG